VRPRPGPSANLQQRSALDLRIRLSASRECAGPVDRSHYCIDVSRSRRLELRFGDDPALRRRRRRLALCHGFSCLAAAGGRLLRPGDAQAGSVVPAATSALLLLYGIGRSFGPRSDRPGSTVRVIAMREEQWPASWSRSPLLCHGLDRQRHPSRAIAFAQERASVHLGPARHLLHLISETAADSGGRRTT
jgi:hypothetical protein